MTSVKTPVLRLPEWLKPKGPSELHKAKQLLRGHRLSTVCEEARCPNIKSCFLKPTATFMILGSKCTRNCGFCSVAFSAPELPAKDEPDRVAMAARDMGLKYVVITSVTRDDLHDGGASQFAGTVMAVKKLLPEAMIEVLTPDFRGDVNALKTVLDSGPHVFNHNVETVPRLYPVVRPQADYKQSLRLLGNAGDMAAHINIKSGLMVGLGETFDEVAAVMEGLRSAGCDFLTVGQYLQPSKKHLPVVEYVLPETFEKYKEVGQAMGFKMIAAAPLVRSSMNAEEMFFEKAL